MGSISASAHYENVGSLEPVQEELNPLLLSKLNEKIILKVLSHFLVMDNRFGTTCPLIHVLPNSRRSEMDVEKQVIRTMFGFFKGSDRKKDCAVLLYKYYRFVPHGPVRVPIDAFGLEFVLFDRHFRHEDRICHMKQLRHLSLSNLKMSREMQSIEGLPGPFNPAAVPLLQKLKSGKIGLMYLPAMHLQRGAIQHVKQFRSFADQLPESLVSLDIPLYQIKQHDLIHLVVVQCPRITNLCLSGGPFGVKQKGELTPVGIQLLEVLCSRMKVLTIFNAIIRSLAPIFGENSRLEEIALEFCLFRDYPQHDGEDPDLMTAIREANVVNVKKFTMLLHTTKSIPSSHFLQFLALLKWPALVEFTVGFCFRRDCLTFWDVMTNMDDMGSMDKLEKLTVLSDECLTNEHVEKFGRKFKCLRSLCLRDCVRVNRASVFCTMVGLRVLDVKGTGFFELAPKELIELLKNPTITELTIGGTNQIPSPGGITRGLLDILWAYVENDNLKLFKFGEIRSCRNFSQSDKAFLYYSELATSYMKDYVTNPFGKLQHFLSPSRLVSSLMDKIFGERKFGVVRSGRRRRRRRGR